MDTINPSQQGSWENNVYFLTTTRILMALGLTFLIRSVYQLFQRMRSADGNGGAAGKLQMSSCYWKETLADGFQWLEDMKRLRLTLSLSS